MRYQDRLTLTGWESFWYLLGCVCTLGVPYFLKIGRKKALIEVWNQEYAYRLQDQLTR